jgi:succinate dehydrogenase / fumarate reductase cytochrome b subunit
LELAVAVSGVFMVLFIYAHLAGNLLLYLGPEAFNDYAKKLHAVPELLWVARIVLITAFVVHVSSAVRLARRNRETRPTRYAVYQHSSPQTPASRLMLLTGLIIFFFVFLHLYDFTLRTPAEEMRMLGGQDLELYAVVWNSFANPLRSFIYIVAVLCVGSHLSHALESMFVTLGLLSDRMTQRMMYASRVLGLVLGLGFASIPLYVLFTTYIVGIS